MAVQKHDHMLKTILLKTSAQNSQKMQHPEILIGTQQFSLNLLEKDKQMSNSFNQMPKTIDP